MTMACIGRYGGGGMQFAPLAKADNGHFNIVSVGDMSLFKRAKSLGYLFNGKINQHPSVRVCETDKFTIRADSDIAFQCDGEVVGVLPIEVHMLSRALRVMVPK